MAMATILFKFNNNSVQSLKRLLKNLHQHDLEIKLLHQISLYGAISAPIPRASMSPGSLLNAYFQGINIGRNHWRLHRCENMRYPHMDYHKRNARSWWSQWWQAAGLYRKSKQWWDRLPCTCPHFEHCWLASFQDTANSCASLIQLDGDSPRIQWEHGYFHLQGR